MLVSGFLLVIFHYVRTLLNTSFVSFSVLELNSCSQNSVDSGKLHSLLSDNAEDILYLFLCINCRLSAVLSSTTTGKLLTSFFR